MLEHGREYGTTTGRERRCGWMDLVALRYAVRLNRMSALAITKLDVLSGHRAAAGGGPLPLQGGRRPRQFPYHQSILHSAKPEYKELPGFDEDITGCRSEADLPPRPATTSTSSPNSSACRCGSSAWAPAATRSSGSATSRASGRLSSGHRPRGRRP